MPKIEVNEEHFFSLAGRRWESREAFEEALTCAKAELDEDADRGVPPAERVLKIELNDTNRPDLWATAGCARALRVHETGVIPHYDFFSSGAAKQKVDRAVIVEGSVKGVRPFLAGFVAKGKAITDAALRDMIQSQEKLAWNFGRKRRAVSMGIYRTAMIAWPIIYKGVDPDSVSFVPLQFTEPLTLRQILKEHPKGKEYGWIQEHEKVHPLLVDAKGGILSYPPIINSADIGAVQVGDSEVFVELTGTDIEAVTLSASIMACDLADQGFVIEPVEVRYDYETAFGATVVTPYYFQQSVFCSLARVEKFLGLPLSAAECCAALQKTGCRGEAAQDVERGADTREAVPGIRLFPPAYRNDFLHAADVIEEVVIGRGLSSFEPARPTEATIGRLLPITLFSRKIKEIWTGLGYQEMIYNYLGSRKDLVERMRGDGGKIVQIANPMTENYEFVRDSVLASLLASEAASAHAVYPHKLFEIGKIVSKNEAENSGVSTRQYLGTLHAAPGANFNTISAELQTFFYYINREYTLAESADPRFIEGRATEIFYQGERAGVFGEIHPAVLENWDITTPCAAAEIDAELLLGSL
ncbi:MAG: phenylalanine--tRNA ligase subunit beta [Spirochaetaceae bacterium]|nr:phenylalanine--tRNA ligase subunit beta [Spirochaetaceae bacterium]